MPLSSYWNWNQEAISYGNASELYFCQYDVMRDLALYLGFRDSAVHGFESTSTLNNTNLQDLNLDHCHDHEVLAPGIYNIQSIHCHLIQNLPSDLGSMSYLRVLRLSALASLKELPSSIGNLVWLEYLDISICEGLKKLPWEIGKLGKLSEFGMRECSRLRRLPRTVYGLGSLKRVICDEDIGKQ
ncbi:hypothetical protein SUGI_0363270 [Cryptomeria japonica]|uniref:probable disease resistance protein At4g33300 n=1 Tax=Cryptomeria japonica TaxID=3369 RepID=UPI002408E03A|nr:probable disease resistance protein At4g33300 [Cryptomeria japonica]GLJ20034.1 hypothetical protein SUGI_0363270 [Cryptomeria japonica]